MIDAVGKNIGLGDSAMYTNTGNSNIAVGPGALRKNPGFSNLVAIGDSALYNSGPGSTGPEEGTLKRYIRGDGGQIELQNGTMVGISRRKKDEFLKAIGH
jgi:hypothetical protein